MLKNFQSKLPTNQTNIYFTFKTQFLLTNRNSCLSNTFCNAQQSKSSDDIEIIPRLSPSDIPKQLGTKRAAESQPTEYSVITPNTVLPSRQQKQIKRAKSIKLSHDIIPASIPLKEDIGKCGLMWPRGLAKQHPAAPLLQDYNKNGCPVDIGKAWSKEHILNALKRGPHISAKDPLPAKVLRKETMEKVKEGYAKIVKWQEIKNNIPPNLKISPVAMIPHKSRLFRAILDLSFQLRVDGKKLPSVNLATIINAPQKAMAELGFVLKRIIYQMGIKYDPNKPFMFSKVDIKDGFWRLMVSEDNAWHFCYVLPPLQGTATLDEIEIVVPNALQMGWCESPPLFCAATETARDVIQALTAAPSLPTHPLETYLIPT